VVAVSAAGIPAPRVGPRVQALGDALSELGAQRLDQPAGAYFVVALDAVHDAARTARDQGFDLLLDVFAIDWLTYPQHRGPRFSVTYHVHAIEANERCWLRVHVDDEVALPTVTDLWPAAGFMEREVYDLFGIAFEGHPDLRKLVTPEDFEGHPLRKDFPIGESPTLFNDGRFLDPAAFRAGMIGASSGRTGWVGGARRGVSSNALVPVDDGDPVKGGGDA
jgi:NADH-quinone oxidoreductase subunit C